jgi:hypothetical protein
MTLNDSLAGMDYEDVGRNGGHGQCRVTFVNVCPPSLAVQITGIGARFWFQDSDGNITDDQIVSKPTGLGPGQSDEVSSSDDCVRTVYAICEVTCNNSPPQQISASAQGDATRCLREVQLSVSASVIGGQPVLQPLQIS